MSYTSAEILQPEQAFRAEIYVIAVSKSSARKGLNSDKPSEKTIEFYTLFVANALRSVPPRVPFKYSK